MKKKLLALLLGVAMVCAIFAGCASETAPSTENTKEPATTEEDAAPAENVTETATEETEQAPEEAAQSAADAGHSLRRPRLHRRVCQTCRDGS